jgi:hypothetical protein
MPITKSNKQRISLDLHKIKRWVDAYLLLLSTNDGLNLHLRNLQITLVLHVLLTSKYEYEPFQVARELTWRKRTCIYRPNQKNLVVNPSLLLMLHWPTDSVNAGRHNRINQWPLFIGITIIDRWPTNSVMVFFTRHRTCYQSNSVLLMSNASLTDSAIVL